MILQRIPGVDGEAGGSVEHRRESRSGYSAWGGNALRVCMQGELTARRCGDGQIAIRVVDEAALILFMAGISKGCSAGLAHYHGVRLRAVLHNHV